MKKALLIGINYKNSPAELRGCINDINDIKNILVENCDYQESNITVLTEEHQNMPTRKNIESYINWLVTDIFSGDTILFYYSGHGFYKKDLSGDEFDYNDELLVPLDYETQGFISDDWLLKNLIEKIPHNATLWAFADCCHSGTILDLKYNYQSKCSLLPIKAYKKNMDYNSSDWNDKYLLYLEKQNDVQGTVCLFTGCQDEEQSIDAFINNKAQGAFTHCFLELLQNNLITLSDGTKRLKTSLTLKDVLKELNARLEIYGFLTQNAQLSTSHSNNLTKIFEL